MLLLWIIYVISVLFLLCFHACLFIDALWSPAGKGLTLGSGLWCLIVKLSLFYWYPGSGVVLDCMDSWPLPSFLLLLYEFRVMLKDLLDLAKCVCVGGGGNVPFAISSFTWFLLLQDSLWYTQLYCSWGATEEGPQLWSWYMGPRLCYVSKYIWAATWDFQQCGMCDQPSLRSACTYAHSDQSLCKWLEYSISVKLLTEQNLEFLILKGGCTSSYESTVVKMPHCWKSHVAAHFYIHDEEERSDSVVECTTWDQGDPWFEPHWRHCVVSFS